MTWRYVGQNSNFTVVTSGNLTLSESDIAVAPGQLLVACIAARGNAAFTLPSGWQLVGQESSGNTSTTATSSIASGLMAYTIRGTSAPNLTFTRTGGDVAMGIIMAYENPKLTGTLDVAAAVTMAANGTLVEHTAGFTTTEDNTLLLMMVAAGDNGSGSGHTNVTNPLTWTERVEGNTVSGADTGMTVAEAIKATAGATGALRSTQSISSRHVMIAGAFKLWSESAVQEEVTKLSSYAVMSPPPDGPSVSKLSTYGILSPPNDSLSIAKASVYAVLGPKDTRARRFAHTIPAMQLGTVPFSLWNYSSWAWSGSTPVFTNVDIGGDVPERYIYLAITGVENVSLAAREITSVTVNGVAATRVIRGVNGTNGMNAEIWRVQCSGTKAEISIGHTGYSRFGVTVHRVLKTSAPTELTAAQAGTSALSITPPAGAIVLACAVRSSFSVITMSGITTVYSFTATGNHYHIAGAQENVSGAAMSIQTSVNTSRVLCAVAIS